MSSDNDQNASNNDSSSTGPFDWDNYIRPPGSSPQQAFVEPASDPPPPDSPSITSSAIGSSELESSAVSSSFLTEGSSSESSLQDSSAINASAQDSSALGSSLLDSDEYLSEAATIKCLPANSAPNLEVSSLDSDHLEDSSVLIEQPTFTESTHAGDSIPSSSLPRAVPKKSVADDIRPYTILASSPPLAPRDIPSSPPFVVERLVLPPVSPSSLRKRSLSPVFDGRLGSSNDGRTLLERALSYEKVEDGVEVGTMETESQHILANPLVADREHSEVMPKNNDGHRRHRREVSFQLPDGHEDKDTRKKVRLSCEARPCRAFLFTTTTIIIACVAGELIGSASYILYEAKNKMDLQDMHSTGKAVIVAMYVAALLFVYIAYRMEQSVQVQFSHENDRTKADTQAAWEKEMDESIGAQIQAEMLTARHAKDSRAESAAVTVAMTVSLPADKAEEESKAGGLTDEKAEPMADDQKTKSDAKEAIAYKRPTVREEKEYEDGGEESLDEMLKWALRRRRTRTQDA